MDILRHLVWLLLSCARLTWSGWQDNLRPRMYLQPRLYSDYQIFEGNKTDPDNFEVILVDGEHVLVGGRNTVYKLQLRDLKLRQLLEWNSSEQDKSVCLVKGKSETFCQNYIKVLKKFENDEGRYLMCGTNAFKPECREYVEDAGTYLMTKKSKGVGMCPYSPEHNSTSVLVQDQLYAGTAADYQGVDPIIYRDPLRTPQFDSTYLNNPSFVGSFDDEDFVYFFFREGAVEYMNCGKSVFSRVARVCKNDLGGTRSLNAKWTSFLKARLNCSVPGNYPFYFDEIQDISQLIKGSYGDQVDSVVYAVFRTAPNSISGSAVCAFRLRDFAAAFEGQFKEQKSTGDNWLAVEHHKVPSPRPGSCPNNSKELTDANLNFIKTHPLMNDAVPPFFGSPVLLRTGFNTGFTAIDVDAQVMAPDGSRFDVIFVGSSTGHLLKAVNSLSPKSRTTTRTVIIEEIELMSSSIKIVQVVSTKKGAGHVLVTSAEEMRSVALYRCDKATTCGECVALQDPYCAWDTRGDKCAGAQAWPKGSQAAFLQSVPTGRHAECPAPATPPATSARLGTVINQLSPGAAVTRDEAADTRHSGGPSSRGGAGAGLVEVENPSVEASVVLFSLETLIITVSAGAVAALVVGFVTGYCCGRKCGKEDANVPYTDAEYEYFEQRQLPARPLGPGAAGPGPLHPLLAHTDKRAAAEEQVYAEPILVNNITNIHHVNTASPLGTTLGSKPVYAAGGAVLGGVGMGPGLAGLQQHNKFNTISNIHKRGGGHLGRGLLSDPASHGPGFDAGPGVNHYEKTSVLLNRHRPGAGLGGEAGLVGGANTVYHMGTISRAAVTKQNSQNNADKNQQVVDSAYGTTRSVKKVYL